jgi:hypothetical protein
MVRRDTGFLILIAAAFSSRSPRYTLRLFGGEGALSALSAAAYADPGDDTGDREAIGFAGGSIKPEFDAEAGGSGHWRRACSRSCRA